MNISCQSIINPERPMQGIIDIKRAEFEGISLCVSAHFPKSGSMQEGGSGCSDASCNRSREEWLEKRYSPETIGERYGEIIEKCNENNIRISAVSTPSLPYMVAEETNYVAFMRKCAVEGIRLCSQAGCNYMVVPPLRTENERAWENNREFYLTLAETAREYGVRILLKNQGKEKGGRLVRGVCAESFQAAEWIDRLNDEVGEELFGFCLDIGICSLCGNDIHEFISELGQRIRMVVLKDCSWQRETALLPFTCVDSGTDWLGVIRGLRDVDFDGELVIDFSGTMRAFSPLLRPALYKLARETVKYFSWQIGLEQGMKKYKKLVLFGAGNMCRNYMKNYGEKYPPLFTCDNNSKLWGTEFCGLEVKSPEALKNLPEDCGIFICNIYYREIEEQLRAMGVERNIEYFNDEYMQLFDFNRLDIMAREQ